MGFIFFLPEKNKPVKKLIDQEKKNDRDLSFDEEKTLVVPPKREAGGKSERVEHKENRMKPKFASMAFFGVNPFVFRHQKARKSAETHINKEARRRDWRENEEKVASEGQKRIYRVTQALPPRQPSTIVKVKLIDSDGCTLKKKRKI
jgi:hypothetical protein